ncbi:MAG: hypothetical protein H0V14_03785 [Chitinophagaceae bacterium]|nr:hypothetical protein [Chitinophagaceae bacterium]
MKKLAAIFFLIIYGFTSVGATVHIHYCMNELVGWSLSKTNTEKCGKCGMEKESDDGCCTDLHKQIQHKDSHKKVDSSPGLPYFTGISILPQANAVINIFYSFTTVRGLAIHPPPLITLLRLHILKCVFLI